jgi:hypothetical protein
VKGLIEAACSQLQQLKFVVQLPEQVLELPVAGDTYCADVVEGDQDQDWREHLVRSMDQLASLLEPDTKVSTRMDRPQRDALEQQVGKQAANLLRLAHVLRLQPLLDVLHGFALLNADRLLWDVGGLVFNDAVLEAALGSSTLDKGVYINSVLSEPFGLVPCKFGPHPGLQQGQRLGATGGTKFC